MWKLTAPKGTVALLEMTNTGWKFVERAVFTCRTYVSKQKFGLVGVRPQENHERRFLEYFSGEPGTRNTVEASNAHNSFARIFVSSRD